MSKVAILMGSDSDLNTMSDCFKVLKDFGVSYEVRILSAHRCPEETAEFAKGAKDNGFKVIIAGAGGAAHLPGVLAALSTLPVIGVPISSGLEGGLDALLSIVQMPKGIPVATVGVDNSRNAGLLALRILATSDEELALKYKAYVEKMRAEVLEKDSKCSKEYSNN